MNFSITPSFIYKKRSV